MNIKIRDEGAFRTEYQNEPFVKEEDRPNGFNSDTVNGILSNRPRGWAPDSAQFLTAFVDVHKNLLYFVVCAWDEAFNGVVVDFDVYPRQRRRTFTLGDCDRTLWELEPGASLEASLYSALEDTVDALFGAEYVREDGVKLDLRLLAIDANWGPATELVYQFIAESRYRSSLRPSHGMFVGAASRPFAEYAVKRGDIVGPHWRQPNEAARRGVRKLLVDTNYWKTFVFARLSAKPGETGRLVVDGSVDEVCPFADHLAAEFSVPVEAKGRRVDEWKARPGRDNHWFDCLVGTAVLASICGASMPGVVARARTRRRVSFAELG